MTRLEGWEDRYLEVMASHEREPFSWSGSNCFYLVMDVCRSVTGEDPYEGERGCKSEADFERRLVRLGFKDVGDAFAAVFEEISPSLARRADCGTVSQENGDVAGVVVDVNYVVGKSPTGREHRVRADLTRAFRIG